MNLDIISQFDIIHRLGRDENELAADGATRGLDHHGHAGGAVDAVHEDVELVETADGRAHGFPDAQEQTDGGERFLASAEGFRLAARVRDFGQVRLDADVEHAVRVVHDDAAPEVALAQQVGEVDSRTSGYVFAEETPAAMTFIE